MVHPLSSTNKQGSFDLDGVEGSANAETSPWLGCSHVCNKIEDVSGGNGRVIEKWCHLRRILSELAHLKWMS